jgi:hypothetical protein
MSTSTLLAGSKTGPCGVYQGTEPLQGAIHGYPDSMPEIDVCKEWANKTNVLPGETA